MVINRDKKTVTITHYKPALDSYGQSRTAVDSQKTIEMKVVDYNQSNISNPKYLNIVKLGLISPNEDIDTDDEVLIDNDKYIVKYIIPSQKLYQVFMENK